MEIIAAILPALTFSAGALYGLPIRRDRHNLYRCTSRMKSPGFGRRSDIFAKRSGSPTPTLAEAALQTLARSMERRLAAMENRRLHPFDQDELPGG